MLLLGEVLRRQAADARRADKVAAIFEARDGREQRATYRELNRRANRLANALLAEGVAPGDRVAVLGRNSLEYVAIYFALAKLGAVMVPVNFWYRAAELKYTLDQSGSSTLLLAGQFLDTLAPVAADLPSLRRTYVYDADGATAHRRSRRWPTRARTTSRRSTSTSATRTSSSTRPARPASRRARRSPTARTTCTPWPGRCRPASPRTTSAWSSTRSSTPADRTASSCRTSSSAARS